MRPRAHRNHNLIGTPDARWRREAQFTGIRPRVERENPHTKDNVFPVFSQPILERCGKASSPPLLFGNALASLKRAPVHADFYNGQALQGYARKNDDVPPIFSPPAQSCTVPQSSIAAVCVRQRARFRKASACASRFLQQMGPSRIRAQERRRSSNFLAARSTLSGAAKLHRRRLCSATRSPP